MFFLFLLNNASTWDRPQWFLNDKVFVFFHSPHIYHQLPDHHTYKSLDTLQGLQTPGDASIHGFISFLHMPSPRESLKLSWISKCKLLNQPQQQFRLLKKKSLHLSNSDIAWYPRRLRVHGVYMTDWWSQISCQTSRSLSTISLECLSHLARAMQVAWLFMSKPSCYTPKVFVLSLNILWTWTKFRPHWLAFGPVLSCSPSGSGSLTENVQFYFDVSPFCTIFFHYTTHHFDMDRYI